MSWLERAWWLTRTVRCGEEEKKEWEERVKVLCGRRKATGSQQNCKGLQGFGGCRFKVRRHETNTAAYQVRSGHSFPGLQRSVLVKPPTR